MPKKDLYSRGKSDNIRKESISIFWESEVYGLQQ
jgi:hypothetical protein